MFLKISCRYLWWLCEEMLKMHFCTICSEWSWTFQNDLEWPWSTSPCLKEHLLSTSISDERFRRYELERTDTTATVCSPEFFSGSIKMYWIINHLIFHVTHFSIGWKIGVLLCQPKKKSTYDLNAQTSQNTQTSSRI
jgi:hypothetical protein